MKRQGDARLFDTLLKDVPLKFGSFSEQEHGNTAWTIDIVDMITRVSIMLC